MNDRQAAFVEEMGTYLSSVGMTPMAGRLMAREQPGRTLSATALVHEAYLRLVDVDQAQHWNSRRHFFAACAEAMRRILVEKARRKGRQRHGGGRQRQPLDLDDHAFATEDLRGIHPRIHPDGGIVGADKGGVALVLNFPVQHDDRDFHLERPGDHRGERTGLIGSSSVARCPEACYKREYVKGAPTEPG